jgi:hypothetical protein
MPSFERYCRCPGCGECDANAAARKSSLIAAAPEMLKALRKARGVMMAEHSIVPDYGWGEFVSKNIDPVIAKAVGKSNG